MYRTLASLCVLWPASLLAQSVGPPVSGTVVVINDGPGDQTDPHLSYDYVAYTSELNGSSEIRYQSFATRADAAIANGGAFDFLSDISGNTVVFTRVTASSAIFAFDLATQAAPVELDPQLGSNRRAASIGGRTVVWQDFGYTGSTLAPEIAAYRLETGEVFRLTDDALLDKTPAVSPDGALIVWSKCQTDNRGCDVWQARAGPSGWVVTQLTATPDVEETQPDTNGSVVVYATSFTVNGALERDIAWRPVGGGAEQRLGLSGVDTNPNVSGSLVAFERRAPDVAGGNFDIALYDLATSTLYNLTSTAENESLNDISVGPDGSARVAWTVPNGSDFNVKALTFRLEAPACEPDEAPAEEVCANPGDRPLLATLALKRAPGKPTSASASFTASGAAVLCLENGHDGSRATSGTVSFNGRSIAGPSAFKKGAAGLAKDVTARGKNQLCARIAGKPGSAFRVRVFARSECVARRGAGLVEGQAVVPLGEAALEAAGGGCSASGGSLTLAGLLALCWLAFRPRPAPVPVKAPRTPRRR